MFYCLTPAKTTCMFKAFCLTVNYHNGCQKTEARLVSSCLFIYTMGTLGLSWVLEVPVKTDWWTFLEISGCRISHSRAFLRGLIKGNVWDHAVGWRTKNTYSQVGMCWTRKWKIKKLLKSRHVIWFYTTAPLNSDLSGVDSFSRTASLTAVLAVIQFTGLY